MKTLYPGKFNSPYTTTTSDIDEDDTTIPVNELWVFPPGPNLAVIGDGSNAETVFFTSKSGNTGPGDLQGVTRGRQGIPRTWAIGTKISRRMTAYDFDSLRENLNDISVFTGTAGGTLSQYDLVCLKSDGMWYPADANTYAASGGQIGVVLEDLTLSASGMVQVAGIVTNASWDLTVGKNVYVSDTPGGIAQNPGVYPRIIGVALSATSINLSPRFTYIPLQAGIVVFNDNRNHIVQDTGVYFSAVYETIFSIASYDWDFGDESTHSSEPSPYHIYNSPDTYEVVLTLTDTDGNIGITRLLLTVHATESDANQGITPLFHTINHTSHAITLNHPTNNPHLPRTGELAVGSAFTSHDLDFNTTNAPPLSRSGDEPMTNVTHTISIVNV